MREAAGSGDGGWRAEFREAVLRWVVQEGSPVDDRSYYNDYHHPDWLGLGAHLNVPGYIRAAGGATAHQREVISSWSEGTPEGGCPLDVERMRWSGTMWTRWGGTMGEDERVEAVDAEVWCACGRVAGVTWRWNGGMAELIRGITDVGSG